MRKIAAHIGCKAKISTSEFEDMEKIIIANDLLIERVVNVFPFAFIKKIFLIFKIFLGHFI